MAMWDVGTVYIVFGDIPRTDGNNIYGVYMNKENAESAKKRAEERDNTSAYSIEKHTIWGE